MYLCCIEAAACLAAITLFLLDGQLSKAQNVLIQSLNSIQFYFIEIDGFGCNFYTLDSVDSQTDICPCCTVGWKRP